MNISQIQQPGQMGLGQMPQANPQIPQVQQQQQQQQQQAQQQQQQQQHQQAQQQQPQQQQQQQHTQEKLDNISKVKSLAGPLRESLAIALKTAASTLHQNSLVDVGTYKSIEVPAQYRFDKNTEEFYSICDQIELHLKTSIECLSQNSSSVRYLPISVAPTRTEAVSGQEGPVLTYPQFLMTVRSQVSYAKDIHDTLISAAHTMTPGE